LGAIETFITNCFWSYEKNRKYTAPVCRNPECLFRDHVIVHLGKKFVRQYGKSFADRIERALEVEHDREIKEYRNKKESNVPVDWTICVPFGSHLLPAHERIPGDGIWLTPKTAKWRKVNGQAKIFENRVLSLVHGSPAEPQTGRTVISTPPLPQSQQTKRKRMGSFRSRNKRRL